MNLQPIVVAKHRLLGTVALSAAMVLTACTAGTGAPAQPTAGARTGTVTAPQAAATTQPGAATTQPNASGTTLPNASGTSQPSAAGTIQPGAGSTPQPGASGTVQPGASGAAQPGTAGAAATSQPLSPDVQRILDRASKSYENLDSFQAAATVTTLVGQRQHSTSLKQWYEDGKLRLELSEPVPGFVSQGTALIADGESVTLFLPDRDQAFQVQGLSSFIATMSLPQQPFVPAARVLELPLMAQHLEQFARNAETKAIGQAQVAGRTVEGIELTPENRQSVVGTQRVWFDQQTGIPLRLELNNQDGQTVLRVVYDSFQPGVAVPDDRFMLPASAKVQPITLDELAETLQWEESTVAQARQAAGYPIATLDQLPGGLQAGAVRTLRADETVFVMQTWTTQAGRPAATLIQGPAGQVPLNVPGGVDVAIDGRLIGHLFQVGDSHLLRWADGRTDYLLATEMTREQTLDLAARLAGGSSGTSGPSTGTSSATAPAAPRTPGAESTPAAMATPAAPTTPATPATPVPTAPR